MAELEAKLTDQRLTIQALLETLAVVKKALEGSQTALEESQTALGASQTAVQESQKSLKAKQLDVSKALARAHHEESRARGQV